MEPRPHERGKAEWEREYYADRMLQWSHVLTNVESTLVLPNDDPSAGASMEPRPHERGKGQSRVNEARLRTGRFNGATSSRTWKDG